MQRIIKQLNTLSITKHIVVYSIPLVCCIALLALLSITISMPSNNTASALNEIGDSTGQPTTSASTTASLTLDTRDIQVRLDAGSIGYASKDITIKATNISSYALTITAPEGLTGPTEFTGADGKTPDEMDNNTWGYNYTDGIVDEAALPTIIYNSFTGTAQTLESGATNPTSNTKTLSFAAKFGNAISGSYKANVVLSLVTTPKAITFDGITTMQEMTPDICNKADTYASSILRDIRDNNYYTVTKLEDGRCWMTNNLILTAPTGGRVLTPADSDVTADWTMPATLTELSSTNFSANSTDGYYTPESYYSNISDAGPTGYYSFTAATAGTGNASLTTGNAPSSICPQGWRLPQSNEYQKLYSDAGITDDTAGSTLVRGMPYNFMATGYTNGGQLGILGQGRWWSSSLFGNNANTAYFSYNNAEYAQAANVNGFRYLGFAVRCIAANEESTQTLETIDTMQEMTPEICENSAVGTSAVLTDNRIYPSGVTKTYAVQKMADKRCWMTQNLRLTGATLTSADSNVIATRSIPASNTSGFSDDAASNAYYNPSNSSSGAKDTAYYTWCAATAGTCSSVEDVCPKGWRLPTGGSGGEFQILYNAGGIKAGGVSPWAYTGHMRGSSTASLANDYGYWWSSTPYGSGDAYHLLVSNYFANSANSDDRCSGFAVRCIAQSK